MFWPLHHLLLLLLLLQRHHHEFHHGAHVRRRLPADGRGAAPADGGPGAHPLPQPAAGQRPHPHGPQQAVPDGAAQELGGQPSAASVREPPQHGRRLLVHQQPGEGGCSEKMRRRSKNQGQLLANGGHKRVSLRKMKDGKKIFALCQSLTEEVHWEMV